MGQCPQLGRVEQKPRIQLVFVHSKWMYSRVVGLEPVPLKTTRSWKIIDLYGWILGLALTLGLAAVGGRGESKDERNIFLCLGC